MRDRAAVLPGPPRRLIHGHAQAAPGTRWVAGWGAAPQPATWLGPGGLGAVTVRDIVPVSTGGDAVRVRLTNAYGRRPLRVVRAAVGLQRTGAAVTGNTELTFRGRRSVTLPPGADLVSDPARLRIAAGEHAAISVYAVGATGLLTGHHLAEEASHLAAGDRARDADGSAFRTTTSSWYLADGLDVLTGATGGAIVAFGDSITDGVGSGMGTDARWPDELARRLQDAGLDDIGVVDTGISGNHVLHDTLCCGVSALTRFRADVVGRAGARTVVLLEGLNDIGFADSQVGGIARQIIAADRRLIAQARAAGLRIVGGTLTPFRGAEYWSPEGEVQREAVNRWIRTSGAFDAVVDFARAVAAPGDPTRLAAPYDSGDHLHPSAAGYRAMAQAVDLRAVAA